jgi:hypothetical protein
LQVIPPRVTQSAPPEMTHGEDKKTPLSYKEFVPRKPEVKPSPPLGQNPYAQQPTFNPNANFVPNTNYYGTHGYNRPNTEFQPGTFNNTGHMFQRVPVFKPGEHDQLPVSNDDKPKVVIKTVKKLIITDESGQSVLGTPMVEVKEEPKPVELKSEPIEIEEPIKKVEVKNKEKMEVDTPTTVGKSLKDAIAAEQDDDSEEEEEFGTEESDQSEDEDVDGKRKYTKDQLLRYRSQSFAPPPELENSEIFSKNPNEKIFGKKLTPTGPVYPNTGRPERKSHGSSSSIRRVKHVQGENAWKPKQFSKSEKEKKLSDIRFILNKIAPESFVKLKEELVNIEIGEEELVDVSKHIFEAAIVNSAYSGMYAALCADLLHGEGKDTIYSRGNFKKIIINSCQEEFEKIPQLKIKFEEAKTKNLRDIELTELKGKIKEKMMGNISFIAELFKKKLLSQKLILTEIVLKLLIKDVDDDDSYTREEDDLEVVIVFMKKTGKYFKMTPLEEAIFEKFEKIQQDMSVPSRIRFLMMDLLELKSKNWEESKKTTKSAPTKPSPVITTEEKKKGGSQDFRQKPGNQDARKQDVRKSRGDSNVSVMKRGGGRGYSPSSTPTKDEDQWETTQSKNSKSYNKRGGSTGTMTKSKSQTSLGVDVGSSNPYGDLEEDESPTTPVKKEAPLVKKEKVPQLPDEQVTKNVTSTCNTLLDGGEIADAILSISAMKDATTSTKVITNLVDVVFTKSDATIRKTLVSILLDPYFTGEMIVGGLTQSIKDGLDNEVFTDLPNYFKWIGEVIAWVHSKLTFTEVNTILSLFSSSQNAKVIPSWLKGLKDVEKVDVLLADSSLDVLILCGDKKTKFESCVEACQKEGVDHLDITIKLYQMINKEESAEDIITFLTRFELDSEDFVDKVCLGVIAAIEFNTRFGKPVKDEAELFAKYGPVLKKFVSKMHAVSALFRIQQFVAMLKYPNEMLLTLWNLLSEHGIIGKGGFGDWKSDSKSSFDKAKALDHTKSFKY